MSEKFESFEKGKESELSKKKKFIDAINKVILKKMKENPIFDIEAFHRCSVCGEYINDNSTDYFLTPEEVPYCSFDCFIKDVHPQGCTCELCGKNAEAEINALYGQLLPEFRKIHGLTGDQYALREARKQFFEKKRKKFKTL